MCIRKLTLSGPLKLGHLNYFKLSRACTLVILQDILALLPNLDSLHLKGVVLPTDTEAASLAERELFDLKQLYIFLPYAEDEYTSEDVRDVLKLLSPFRRIGELRLDCELWHSAQDLELFRVKSFLQPPPQLKIDSLIVESCSDSLFLLYAFNQGQAISQLSSFTVFSLSACWEDPSLHKLMKEFMREVGPRLKSFRCDSREAFLFQHSTCLN